MAMTFCMAREVPGHKLPGNPIAIVESKDPALNQTFLCSLWKPETMELTDSDESDESDDEHKGSKGRVDPKKQDLLMYAKDPALTASHSGKLTMHGFRGAPLVPHASKTPWTQSDPRALAGQGHKPKKSYLSKKVDRKADLDATLSQLPQAEFAAEEYEEGLLASKDKEEDESDEDKKKSAGSKRKRDKEVAPASKPGEHFMLPPDARFHLLPFVNPKWRTSIYVAGRSGSKKSIWSGAYLQRFNKLFPDRVIYGINPRPFKDDPAYEGLKIRQVNPTKLLGSVDMDVMFGKKPCLIIFDDLDGFKNGPIKQACVDAIEELLRVGRKTGKNILVINHELTSYGSTRSIIREADHVIIFPHMAQPGELAYFFEKKLMLPKREIPKLCNMGEWVAIHNAVPQYALGPREAYMIRGGTTLK